MPVFDHWIAQPPGRGIRNSLSCRDIGEDQKVFTALIKLLSKLLICEHVGARPIGRASCLHPNEKERQMLEIACRYSTSWGVNHLAPSQRTMSQLSPGAGLLKRPQRQLKAAAPPYLPIRDSSLPPRSLDLQSGGQSLGGPSPGMQLQNQFMCSTTVNVTPLCPAGSPGLVRFAAFSPGAYGCQDRDDYKSDCAHNSGSLAADFIEACSGEEWFALNAVSMYSEPGDLLLADPSALMSRTHRKCTIVNIVWTRRNLICC